VEFSSSSSSAGNVTNNQVKSLTKVLV